MAGNWSTNTLYVGSSGSYYLGVMNAGTKMVGTTVSVNTPIGVAVNPVTDTAYVTDNVDAAVSVIDGGTNTVVATIGVGRTPEGGAGKSTTNKNYLADFFCNTPSVIERATHPGPPT